MFFGEHSCSFLLSMYLEVEMLNQKVDVCLAIVGSTFKADCASYQFITVQCQTHPYYLLCDNEAGPCKHFSSAIWHIVKLCQERVLTATAGESGFSSWL